MALNLGQFASSLAVIPILVFVGDSYSCLFLIAGVCDILVSWAYGVAWMRELRTGAAESP